MVHLTFTIAAQGRGAADTPVEHRLDLRAVAAIEIFRDDGDSIRLTDDAADRTELVFDEAFGRMLGPAVKTALASGISAVCLNDVVAVVCEQGAVLLVEVMHDDVQGPSKTNRISFPRVSQHRRQRRVETRGDAMLISQHSGSLSGQRVPDVMVLSDWADGADVRIAKRTARAR